MSVVVTTRQRSNELATIVTVSIGAAVALGLFLAYDPESIDDKMEGYGFTKICQAVGYTASKHPVCSKEAWVLGHEVVTMDEATTYIRKREAAE